MEGIYSYIYLKDKYLSYIIIWGKHIDHCKFVFYNRNYLKIICTLNVKYWWLFCVLHSCFYQLFLVFESRCFPWIKLTSSLIFCYTFPIGLSKVLRIRSVFRLVPLKVSRYFILNHNTLYHFVGHANYWHIRILCLSISKS